MSYILIYKRCNHNFVDGFYSSFDAKGKWETTFEQFNTIEDVRCFLNSNLIQVVDVEGDKSKKRKEFLDFKPIKLFKIEKEVEIKINYHNFTETIIKNHNSMNGYSLED